MTNVTHPPELVAGMAIASRFRLEHLLGRGGMGSVWVAHHLTLGVPVAVKFVDPTAGAVDEIRSRFAQEAQAAAKINSPHVVRMVDYGADEWGRPYIAMELLQGVELAKRIEGDQTLELREVARVVAHAAKGLTKAHAAGITHRDLKPENLFLCDDDDGFIVKILDFGIAKADSPVGTAHHRTGTGQIVGTPGYMSPEQALGAGGVDFRSDLYSLGVVAYRCVTGRVPFAATGLGELIVAITSRPHAPPSSLRADLPPDLDAWFDRALAKDPAARFQSARELSDSFAMACGVSLVSGAHSGPRSRVEPSTPLPSVNPTPPAVSASSPAGAGTMMSASSSDLDDVPAPPQRSIAPLFAAAVLGLLVLGGGGALLLRSPGQAPAATTPSSAPSGAPPPRASSSAPEVTPAAPSATASAAPTTSAKARKPGKDAAPPKSDAPPSKPPAPAGGRDYGL
jgi:serine/threonine-protein kinase